MVPTNLQSETAGDGMAGNAAAECGTAMDKLDAVMPLVVAGIDGRGAALGWTST